MDDAATGRSSRFWPRQVTQRRASPGASRLVSSEIALGGWLAVAADVLRLLVPRLRHQHQQGGALLAEAGEAGAPVFVQVPARAGPVHGGARACPYDSRARPVSGQTSRALRTLPGPGRRCVTTNTGPRVRPLISRCSCATAPAGGQRRARAAYGGLPDGSRSVATNATRCWTSRGPYACLGGSGRASGARGGRRGAYGVRTRDRLLRDPAHGRGRRLRGRQRRGPRMAVQRPVAHGPHLGSRVARRVSPATTKRPQPQPLHPPRRPWVRRPRPDYRKRVARRRRCAAARHRGASRDRAVGTGLRQGGGPWRSRAGGRPGPGQGGQRSLPALHPGLNAGLQRGGGLRRRLGVRDGRRLNIWCRVR